MKYHNKCGYVMETCFLRGNSLFLFTIFTTHCNYITLFWTLLRFLTCLLALFQSRSKSVSASAWCLECFEYLCSKCEKQHSKNHDTQPLKELIKAPIFNIVIKKNKAMCTVHRKTVCHQWKMCLSSHIHSKRYTRKISL